MKRTLLISTLLLAASQAVPAADAPAAKAPAKAVAKAPAAPKTNFVDYSSAAVMDKDGATAVLAAAVPAKVWKLYPASKWAFVSQAEGGITSAGACVVTARVFIVPMTVSTRKPLLHPEKMATAFDTAPGATRESCRDLAKAKLKEAAEAVVSSLVKT